MKLAMSMIVVVATGFSSFYNKGPLHETKTINWSLHGIAELGISAAFLLFLFLFLLS